MKLPEEFGKSEIDTANDLRIAEAIVRDCANEWVKWDAESTHMNFREWLFERYDL